MEAQTSSDMRRNVLSAGMMMKICNVRMAFNFGWFGRTSVTGSSVRRGRRDSISSRRSARSDLDSNFGDEDWQVSPS